MHMKSQLKQNKRWINYIVITTTILIMACTFSGCYLLPEEEDMLEAPLLEASKVEYQTLEVKKGEIISYVKGFGNFESARQADCFFEHRSGRIRIIHVKIGDEVKKGDILAELDTDMLKRQETVQYYDLEKAKLRYEHLQATRADSYDVKMAEYDFLIAESNYKAILEELNKSILYAPMEGIIAYIARILPGDTINAYTDLIRIIDPKDVHLVVEGEEARSLKTGMKVEVTIGSDDVYEGEVIQSPGDTPSNPADSDTTPRAIIDIGGYNPDERVIGKQANIKFVDVFKDNVIVIPKRLVTSYGHINYIKVLLNGEMIEVDVELGIETPTEVEIVKGLNEGDLVIVK